MNFYDKVIQTVKKIPRGKVATYGQIAALCGSPRAARQVGWALHHIEAADINQIPWHRVVNREGRISTTCLEHPAAEQALLLKKEKISIQLKNDSYFVDLKKYLWRA